MKKRSLHWKEIMTTLFFFLSIHFVAMAQNVTVQGTVSDVKGEPLPGVSIILEGTTQGTITNFDGKYSIEVPSDAQLTFQFIGFNSQVIAVNGQTTINVTLEEDVVGIDEVVVVGYGTQRKEAVTGSVANMKGEEMRSVPAANVSQSLQGRVAGVQMAQTSSKPGSVMQIRIRGTRSLNADNDPLVVLDGIPFAGSIADINPSDIKSVDILKDASATAIYGSRGANGVILITTNKGYKGEKATVTYNGYYGMKSTIKYPMMNGDQLMKLRTAADIYGMGEDEAEGINTDWQDELYRSAAVTSHDIGVSGGSEKGNYSAGLGYYKDESPIPLQDYERISLRASLDQEIGKYFRVGLSTTNNYSTMNGANLGLYSTLSMSPLASPYNEDGTIDPVISMPLDNNWAYTEKTLNDLGDKYKNQTRALGTYNNVYGEVKIPGVEGLKYRMNLGLNLRLENYGNYRGQGIFTDQVDRVSEASISNSLKTNWAVENIITYDKTIGKHNFNVVALYSAEETMYTKSGSSAKDIPSDHFQFYNLNVAAGEKTLSDGDYYKSGLTSYMGRVMYAYDNKYMLSATVRTDGASVLASGHEWHTYPAVSAGWNIKNEPFMESITAIDMLKLRVGYGETSNQAIAPYATLGSLADRKYNFNDLYTTGYYVNQVPNDALGWEYSETWNYGADFTLLNGRLSGTLEYYITKTKDVLLEVNLPQTAGVDSYWANIGETQNKGFELSLNGTIIDNKNGWSWDAGFNLYANRNKLVKLDSGQKENTGQWWFVGEPIDVIYDYKREGLWQADDPYLDILEPGGDVGMIKVQYTGEYNADGTPVRAIGPDDQQVINIEPKFEGGFNTRVAYKNLDLTAVGAFRNGGTLISTLHSSSGYLNMLSGRRNNVDVDYWTESNTDARYPNPAAVRSGDNPKYGSTLGYFKSSYMKVRSITLGYNLSKSTLLKNSGISKLRVYATVTNPFVMFSPFKKATGLDPESNSYGNENAATTETYKKRLLTVGTNTPTTRNFLIGLNLTF
ncbi:SusC/RagA family TonB-linked outer membrane protein [Plebeiibacterium sediminum]|uniref:TonB-dependent receptor n=1 Tax=Plebeiibacterium sediminum TaxID=2992112 RepID=A0AAE3M1N4_9BACT|nr:TonB-dependent receptor [Plebeiobacterium sediminum]MCW3785572.1 TonB-dependent receptor [Plebeiobacterium sediminum]